MSAVLVALALLGGGYVVVAAALTARFLAGPPAPAPAAFPAVSLLKPLYRNAEGLAEALETFGVQDYPGEVQIVLGVREANDPALAVARAFETRHRGMDVVVVLDPAVHGENLKVSNLINLAARARHEVLILSDADIAVTPGYLRSVAAALGEPGVGAVSCLYVGAPTGGLWARLAAMAIDYGFLPSVVLGRAIGLAHPCMGSTIALSRDTLQRIGGFEAVRDVLADDYEIGRAVRALGLTVAIPRLTVAHATHEPTFQTLLAHEIRWNRTVRLIDPAGYAGSVITNPLPLALLAAASLGFGLSSLALVFVLLGVRVAAKLAIDRATGARAGPSWLIPARDVLSFGVFLASLAGDTVDWQGRRFRVSRGGVLGPLRGI